MRIWIDKGRYMDFRSITDPHSYLSDDYYDTFVEYRVYNEDGTPSTGSYRGEAHVSKGVIVIGDPRYQANLTELRISPEPTEASKDRFEGFLRAIDEKRRPPSKGLAKYENKSTDWWDGYRDGWEQKDERKAAKKRTSNPADDAAEFARVHASDATWTPRIPGGTTKPPRAFNPQALVAGTLVELEHTTDPAIAMEITMDHLDRDPRHYDRELAAARHRNPSPASARRPVLRETRLSRRVKST